MSAETKPSGHIVEGHLCALCGHALFHGDLLVQQAGKKVAHASCVEKRPPEVLQ